MQPNFEVRADYFYALTANLSTEISIEQRLKIATLRSEEQLLTEIETAIDTSIIADNLSINKYQAARRLHALGNVTEADIEYTVGASTSPVFKLVQAWLNQNGVSVDNFWKAAAKGTPDADLARGHL